MVVVGVVLACRLAAPAIVAQLINERLSRIPEYNGSVGDVDLALIRGACAVEDLQLRKAGGEAGAPLLKAERAEFSIAWGELVRGRFLGAIHVRKPAVTLVRTADPRTGQVDVDERWQEAIESLAPIDIARLEVEGADIHYVDTTQDPHIDISLHDLNIRAEGLRNRRTDADTRDLPARAIAVGRTVGDGTIQADLRIAPLEWPPLFDLDLAVRKLPLSGYNTLLRAYANVDVSRGEFDLFLEVAAREGGFEGYVKPFFRDLQFENITDRERSVIERIWESVVHAMETVLKNPERQQLGTRVPFSGTFEETQVGTWTAMVNTVRYGFDAAFSEAVEGSIQPEDVSSATAPPR